MIEATEFSLSQGVAAAVPLMEKTLIDYLNNMGVETIQKGEVDMQAILPKSFRTGITTLTQ